MANAECGIELGQRIRQGMSEPRLSRGEVVSCLLTLSERRADPEADVDGSAGVARH